MIEAMSYFMPYIKGTLRGWSVVKILIAGVPTVHLKGRLNKEQKVIVTSEIYSVIFMGVLGCGIRTKYGNIYIVQGMPDKHYTEMVGVQSVNWQFPRNIFRHIVNQSGVK